MPRRLALISLLLLSACGEKTPPPSLFASMAVELDSARAILAGVSQPTQAQEATRSLLTILDRLDALQKTAMDKTAGSTDRTAFNLWLKSLAGVRSELIRLEQTSPETAQALAPVRLRLQKYY